MKETLDTLWKEYFSEVCARIETEEERALIKKAGALSETVNALLTEEQRAALHSYTDSLCEMQSIFLKKAFLKGCAFTVSFFLEAR